MSCLCLTSDNTPKRRDPNQRGCFSPMEREREREGKRRDEKREGTESLNYRGFRWNPGERLGEGRIRSQWMRGRNILFCQENLQLVIIIIIHLGFFLRRLRFCFCSGGRGGEEGMGNQVSLSSQNIVILIPHIIIPNICYPPIIIIIPSPAISLSLCRQSSSKTTPPPLDVVVTLILRRLFAIQTLYLFLSITLFLLLLAFIDLSRFAGCVVCVCVTRKAFWSPLPSPPSPCKKCIDTFSPPPAVCQATGVVQSDASPGSLPFSPALSRQRLRDPFSSDNLSRAERLG
ncbi:hypothetical protein LZ30DRAFT_698640 [Colletotrichum cereale]|nr:hypothetical protein LZ30DRAFT_698640 [Colletotrichum cereale]